jgi:hypothetical protein
VPMLDSPPGLASVELQETCRLVGLQAPAADIFRVVGNGIDRYPECISHDPHISDAILVVPPLAYGIAHASFSFRLVFASCACLSVPC